jgi:hypothetical protein
VCAGELPRFLLGFLGVFLFTPPMAIVSIGPFLVKNGQSGPVASDLNHAGYSVELSSDEFVLKASLYRHINQWQPEAIRLEDFYICTDDIPFGLLPVAEIQVQKSPLGRLVSLEAMLCSLYVKHEVRLPITSLLVEFRDHLPVNRCNYPRIENGSKLLNPGLAKAGFEVIKYFCYGRTLSVQFGWVFPQDRHDLNSKLNLYAGMIEFRPKPDRTLGKGRWIIPIETSLSYLFTDMLESSGNEGLLSETGIQAAVDSFKWTKVSLLTNREAKQARIEFVREHHELHADPRALARALKRAELYSNTTEIYAIKKQVPRLIREATGK